MPSGQAMKISYTSPSVSFGKEFNPSLIMLVLVKISLSQKHIMCSVNLTVASIFNFLPLNF
ncbi:hypothetical protein GCM10011338_30380 [Alteromonas lipolytica]|nr:hypothetical protein GCM10011338_30380 [Alteromonas lipolytica]